MKASILQENLQKALSAVSRIIPTRAQLPILQNVLLRTQEKRIMVVGTSLDTTVVYWVDGKVEKDGAVSVPARVLSEFVTTLPPQTVSLEEREGSLGVSCSGFHANLATSPPAEFPPPPTRSKTPKTSIAAADLVNVLGRALFAAAADEARPILSGVRFVQTDDETVAVATDGYRLSRVGVGLKLAIGTDVVVPARALFEVLRLSKETATEGMLSFSMTDDGQLVFVVGDGEIYTRRIDGEYPPVEKIIPKTYTTRATFDTDAMTLAVKSAAIFARDNSNIVRLSVGGGKIVVSANAPSVGENKIDVEANVEGEGGEIAFNSRFLLEYFSAVNADQVSFEMTGSLNPGAFRPASPDDDSFLPIIMPVRVQT